MGNGKIAPFSEYKGSTVLGTVGTVWHTGELQRKRIAGSRGEGIASALIKSRRLGAGNLLARVGTTEGQI